MNPTPEMQAYFSPILERSPVERHILRQVPVPYLAAVWGDVAEWLASVIERSGGRWSIEQMAGKFLSGDWQLWVVWSGDDIAAVIGTEIYTEETGMKLARVVFTTGHEAAKWSHLVSDIEDWARSEGAARLEMMARKGWAKYMPDYKMTHVLLEKDLRDGK